MRKIAKKKEYDIDSLRYYMRLSPAKKLEYLEQLNKFLNLATPPKNKEIWKKLKAMGW